MHQANSKDSGFYFFDFINSRWCYILGGDCKCKQSGNRAPLPCMNWFMWESFDVCRSTLSVQKFSSAVRPYPFENFLHPFSRSTSSVRKFSSSKIFFSRSVVRPHPFENFLYPFSRSTSSVRKFSSSVQPFALSVLNGLPTRFSSVRLPCVWPFERIPLGTFSRERSHFS